MSGEVCDWAVNGGNVRGSAYLLLTINKQRPNFRLCTAF